MFAISTPHQMTTVAATTLVTAVLMLADLHAAQVSSPPPVPASPSLAHEAMVFHVRATNDPSLLAEQLYAATLHRQGVSPSDIVQRTLVKRREWARLRREGIQGEWNINPYGQTVIRLLGRAATQLADAGGTGVELANLGLLAYEDVMRGRAVSRSAQRLAEEIATWQDAFPEDGMAQLFVTTYAESAEYRDAWDPLFLPILGFRPTSPDSEVLQHYPSFANHEALSNLVASSASLERTFQLLRTYQTRNLLLLRSVSTRIVAANEAAADTRVQREVEEAARQRQRRDQFEAAGYRSAVSLAATIVGLQDPILAQQIHVTNNAVFSALDATRAYEVALIQGMNPVLAGTMLGNAWVGIGVTLMDSALATGPPADQIIVDQITALREQVAALGSELHGRFNHIQALLLAGFDGLAANTRVAIEALRAVTTEIRSARLQLDEAAQMEVDTQAILLRQGDALRDLIAGLALADCRRPYVPGELSTEMFRNCLGRIEELARSLPGRQVFVASATAQSTWLEALPDRMLGSSLTWFKTLLSSVEGEEQRAALLAEGVVGPESWFYIADMQDEFLVTHPALAVEDARAIENSWTTQTMNAWRLQLVRYAEAIRDEVKAFQAQARPTVFSRLLAHAWDGPTQELVDEWSRDGGDYSMEAVRAVERRMSVANAHLRLWIGLAFYNAIGRFPVVTDVLAGQVRLPDRPGDWKVFAIPVSELHTAGTWEARSGAAEVWYVIGEAVAAVENVLRSAAMEQVVEYGYGHRLLMETRFQGVDGVEVCVDGSAGGEKPCESY